jgi:hypothetical protein
MEAVPFGRCDVAVDGVELALMVYVIKMSRRVRVVY